MEKEFTKHLIEWLDQEYGSKFCFKKIEAAIGLTLKNHRRKILEEGITAWISTKSDYPKEDGYYYVVISGHGKRYQSVDFWDLDDHQWQAEYVDPDVKVTSFMPLFDMPDD